MVKNIWKITEKKKKKIEIKEKLTIKWLQCSHHFNHWIRLQSREMEMEIHGNGSWRKICRWKRFRLTTNQPETENDSSSADDSDDENSPCSEG